MVGTTKIGKQYKIMKKTNFFANDYKNNCNNNDNNNNNNDNIKTNTIKKKRKHRKVDLEKEKQCRHFLWKSFFNISKVIPNNNTKYKFGYVFSTNEIAVSVLREPISNSSKKT